MDKTLLKLKPGVTLIEQDGGFGFTLDGRTKFAKNAEQEIILRALAEQPQTLEKLFSWLCVKGSTTFRYTDASLALAEFILDLDYYIDI
ncbi:MAG: hypothetical protein VB119_10645 [Candidatus Metalachnospira sp.]|nr:hypothetical protein [Candidatus Metalachnospira sp.]